ncbi:MAG: hypothetical protein BHW58_03005 [Azospirillum sp. 51_20]|nr:MAG: hypothetical protein BHW58_03005 [Azospirillum sp. 51_20]
MAPGQYRFMPDRKVCSGFKIPGFRGCLLCPCKSRRSRGGENDGCRNGAPANVPEPPGLTVRDGF